jgi:hypothetical protein
MTLQDADLAGIESVEVPHGADARGHGLHLHLIALQPGR